MLRLFLAIVARNKLKYYYFNIKNVYTELKLKELIFLTPPQGVAIKKGKILHALHSLYSLKQSSQD